MKTNSNQPKQQEPFNSAGSTGDVYQKYSGFR